MLKYFITGTDTDVGKTFITRIFLTKIKQQHQTVVAIKPVACGVVETSEGFKNEDALFLQQESTVQLPYSVINPFLLHAPVSPHIAAQNENIILTAQEISAACEVNFLHPVDYLFAEGAGGWMVPINSKETMADVALLLQMPVILVIDMRLGCLNHSLLTVDSILNQSLNLAGFVLNQTQATPQDALKENIATLVQRIPAPLLGFVPYSINKDITNLTQLLQLPEPFK